MKKKKSSGFQGLKAKSSFSNTLKKKKKERKHIPVPLPRHDKLILYPGILPFLNIPR